MSRKKFIESHGATCKNWQWSWSFINEKEKIIIFGAWDTNTTGNRSLIFSENWRVRKTGKRPPAYSQSREHIRLIEEEGYRLMTFPMIYSDANRGEDNSGPPKIAGITETLTPKTLIRIENDWFASDETIGETLPEEIAFPERFTEGASQMVSVNKFERNSKAKIQCINYHGYKCAVCSFDFEAFYGAIGKQYIHVHHIVPLSEIRKEYSVDPIKDLIPVCANCHAIIHRTQPPLSVSQLKAHLSEIGRQCKQ